MKKIIYLLFLFFILSTGICYAKDPIFYVKISNHSSRSDWATYAVCTEVNGKRIKLDEKTGSIQYIEEIDKQHKWKKRKLLDMNNDGKKDVIVGMIMGRGNPELFYIIDGKSHKIIFHHNRCRNNIGDLSRITVEGRGRRKFKYGKQWVAEILEIPFVEKSNNPNIDCIYGEEKYIYYWNSMNQQFKLRKTIKRKFYRNFGKKIYIP